jgi:hypothetical protein
VWLYLYLVIDVWSRKVVAWDVAEVESAQIAADLLSRACLRERVSKGRRQLNREAASLQIPVFLANRLFPDRCLESFSVQRLQEAVTGEPERFIEQVQQRHSTTSRPWPQADLLAANQTTVAAIKALIGGQLQQSLIHNQAQIQQLKAYTQQLKHKRAIYANVDMAESGGTLALPGYLSYVKGTSTNNERILLKIRILDTIFKLVSKFRLTKINEIIRRLNRTIRRPSDQPARD